MRFLGILTLAFFMAHASAFAFSSNSDPNPGELYKQADKLVQQGQYDKAIPILLEVLQKNPKDADAYNLLGYSYRHRQEYDKALKFYNQALQLEPQHRGANEYLGELYLETNNLPQAQDRLAVLAKACNNCEEYKELEEKIATYKAAHP